MLFRSHERLSDKETVKTGRNSCGKSETEALEKMYFTVCSIIFGEIIPEALINLLSVVRSKHFSN